MTYANSQAARDRQAALERQGGKMSQGDVVNLLNANEGTRSMAKDIGLAVALAKVLNATLELGKDGQLSGAKLAMGLAKKGLATSKVAEKASGNNALAMGNQVAGQFLKTMSLTKLSAATSPGKAATVIGLTVAEKVVMAGGMAEFNKCRTALAQLAITTGATAVAAPTGVGAVVGAIAIASDLFNMYGACYADGKDGKDLEF